MKKFIIALLFSALTLSFIFLPTASVGRKASAAETISTSIVSPSSYLEYRALTDPEDVFIRGKKGSPDYLAVIAEKQKIHIYKDGFYTTVDLPDYSITRVAVWQDYVFFLSGSVVYSFSISEISSTPQIIPTPAVAADYFVITDTNYLITNPSGFIRYYVLAVSEDGLQVSVRENYTVTAGLNPSFLTFYDGKLYYFSGSTLYRAEGSDKVELVNTPHIPRGVAIRDGILYYSCSEGVFSINLNEREPNYQSVVRTSSTPSGGLNETYVYTPQGIFICDGLLYICDVTLDSVVTYDLAARSLTDFAISDRGDLKNRISAYPRSITATDDEVFILDEDKIKVYDYAAKSFSMYSDALIIGSDKISATKYENKTYLLTASGNELKLFEKTKESLTQKKIVKSESDNFQFIQAVCSIDKYFYFVNNTTYAGTPTADLYRLNAETGAIEKISATDGVGQLLCSDVFGKIYLVVLDDGNYVIYGGDEGIFDEKPVSTLEKKPLSFFCDLEDNLFVLLDGNTVTKISNGLYTDYNLSLSANLPSYNATSSCLIPATNKAFFLYGGFMLTTDSLPIKTPQDVPVPADYSISLNESPTKAVITPGSKVFLIDLKTDESATTFAYNGYESEKTEREYYVIGSDDRYYILTDGKRSVAVRKADAAKSPAETKDANSSLYAVADQSAYSYPLTDPHFKLFDLKKNEKVTALKTTVINGKEYTLVQKGEEKGYVASSLLKTAVAADASPEDFYTTTVGKEGADIYSDKDLTQKIGKFSSYETIRIYGKEGNAYLVSFDGKTCYISVASVRSRGYYAIRYLLVVVILVVALFSTGYYLVKTRVFKKKNEDE